MPLVSDNSPVAILKRILAFSTPTHAILAITPAGVAFGMTDIIPFCTAVSRVPAATIFTAVSEPVVIADSTSSSASIFSPSNNFFATFNPVVIAAV